MFCYLMKCSNNQNKWKSIGAKSGEYSKGRTYHPNDLFIHFFLGFARLQLLKMKVITFLMILNKFNLNLFLCPL